MKQWKKAVVLLLAFVFFLSANGNIGNVYAGQLTNASIEKKEEEVKQAKEEKKALQSSLTDVKNIKKQLEQSKANLSAYITELDASLANIQAKIAELKTLISKKEIEIADKEVELEEAIAVQEAQYEAMKARIKFMYEKGNTFYLELLFASESFGDMLNKAEYIEMLSAYDREKLDQYAAQAEYVALCKEGLEEEKGVLEEAKSSVEAEEAAMNELIAAKEQEINAVSSDIKSKEAAIAE